MTPPVLSPLARAAARLLPAAERQAIVGDLLEDAGWRGLDGRRLTLSLWASCSAIAAGFAVDSARTALTPPPAAELAAGVAVDGGHMLRGLTIWTLFKHSVIFCAAVVMLTCGVEMLVAALMKAAGLR